MLVSHQVVTVVLKNGTRISDKVSEEESDGLFAEWDTFLKSGKPPAGGIQLNGIKLCAVFVPEEIACVCSEKS